jgi:hypothetical protein
MAIFFMAARDKSIEQYAMRTGADKNQFGFSRLVDQKPTGRDMTFAVIGIYRLDDGGILGFFNPF